MTPVAINLHPDAIVEVSKQLDIRSVFNFCYVSHATCTALSNNRFLELFMHWNPEVVQYAQSKKDPNYGFSTLVQYHPNNCWKIACCALSTGVFKPNDSFVKEAAPFFVEGFGKEKVENELKLKEITGSFYADPNSLIDQAWKAYNAWEDRYHSLEKERIVCVRKIEDLNHSIHTTMTPWKDGELPHVLYRHRYTLKSEFKHVFARHKMLPLLTECSEFIDDIENRIVGIGLENLDRIRNLINSCGVKCQRRIWGQLYFFYAQNVIEDRWSEKHFHEHLSGLNLQVQKAIDDLHESIKMDKLPPWML